MALSDVFSFPNPVNEVSARTVAGGVAVAALVTLGTRWPWLLPFMAYGFIARVASGPTLSPWGQIVTRVIVPRLPFKANLIPGPPKRFAQGMGVAFTVPAAILWLGFGLELPALILVALLAVAAILESVFAICLGCRVFDVLMRIGIIPTSVCEACANFTVARSHS
ncbi:MAG: DUF4395 domain-containing protein [Candidatus Dormibacteria bacterium]|jgi:hypothetical protein